MAWIKMLGKQESDDRWQKFYDKYQDRQRGKMDHILQIHSLDPDTLEDHVQMYRRLMFGPSELSRKEREMIAVAVSVENQCHY